MASSVPVSSEPRTQPSLLPWLLLGALFAVPIVVTLRPVAAPVLDPDIWWHLRTGEWVVEHRTVPDTDPFSQLGPERRWVAYSWLFEVVVFAFYRWLGLAGIVVVRLLLALAVVLALYRLVRRLEPRLVGVLLTLLGTLALTGLFNERPWLCTMLFTTITLRVIVEFRDLYSSRLPSWVWTLPLVHVVWANVHIQFVYGLGLLALAVVAPLLQPRLDAWTGGTWIDDDNSAQRAGSPRWRQLVVLAALCGAATLITPYHVRLYGVIVEYATQPGPYRWVNELKALEFRAPADWILLGLTGAACYALGRRRLELFDLALLAGSAILAFRARRDLWLVVLADLVVLASLRSPHVPFGQWFRIGRVEMAVLWVVLLALAGVLFLVRVGSDEDQRRTIAKHFPVQAAAFVQEEGYRGPLFNDFTWGGYLIWALPELPVAIDGRTNLHGDERIERFGRVWSGQPEHWHDDPDLAAAAVVISPRDSALSTILLLDKRFLPVHVDRVACVFIQPERQR